MTEQLILGFSLGCISVLILAILRDAIKMRSGKAMLLLLVGVMGFITRDLVAPDFRWINSILLTSIPATFWLLSHWVFSPHLHLPRIIALIALFSVAGPAINGILSQFGQLPSVVNVALIQLPSYLEYFLLINSFWIIWVNRAADLVEERRKLRFRIVVIVGFTVGFNVLSLKFGLVGFYWLMASVATAALLTTHFLLQTHNELFVDTRALNQRGKLAKEEVEENPDEEELSQLVRLMNSGFYKTEKLTLSHLAKEMKLPEYRMRQLINQNLGYRNFNDYVNQLRIAEAMNRLLQEPDTPITNISLDIGYRTMSSFNRAFKEIAGMNPTDYRHSSE